MPGPGAAGDALSPQKCPERERPKGDFLDNEKAVRRELDQH